MFEFICLWIGVILIGGSLYAYWWTRDGLHPAIILSPLFLYIYVSTPIVTKGGLQHYFSDQQLEYVAAFYLAAVICLYAGLLRHCARTRWSEGAQQGWAILERPHFVRKRMFAVAVLLGLIALAAYLYSLEMVGGFVKAYSYSKGGGRVESGYIGEATLLSFPAIVLLALSRRKIRIRPFDVALALLFALPHLLHGTFGGRRGPLFLILGILFIAWFIANGRTPSLRAGVLAVCVAGLAVLLVWSQRKHIYLGSEGELDTAPFLQRVLAEEPTDGSTYVTGAASVLTADHLEKHYWGYRYFVTFFVRPIPKQLWPTKYEDMGADWVISVGEEERAFRYLDAVGFALLAGSATGSLADGYMEFAWGAPILFYLIGALYAWLWKRHRQEGGFWTVILAVSLVLSIYLATQSVTAWGTRMLYISLFTYLIWRFWLRIPVSQGFVGVRRRRAPMRHPHFPMRNGDRLGRTGSLPSRGV